VSDNTSNPFAWLGDDFRQIDPSIPNRRFHEELPMLQGCESVEMAFKGRRDMTLFTTKRILIVDIKGWSGKKVQYLTLPYSAIQAFAVRSAGSFMDKDSELMLWTDIMHEPKQGDNPPEPGMSYLEQDFQKDNIDLFAIHRYMSEKVLGLCAGRPLEEISAGESLVPSPSDAVEQLLNWLGNDAAQLNAQDVDAHLHSANAMLQSDERVEMAFKAGRDTTVFTTKRVFVMDVQGFSGKKIMYRSVPYTSVRGFSVCSAGSWDTDAEMKLHLRCPWLKSISQDFRKGRADILAIQRLLSHQLLDEVAFGIPLELESSTPPTNATAVGNVVAWLGDNASQVDPQAVNERFHSNPAILQHDEIVEIALKSGRDLFLFTSKRVLSIDVQGFTGSRVEYQSFPYKHCLSFAVESAGRFDVDGETRVCIDSPGVKALRQDLRWGRVDMWSIQTVLCNKLLL
jgi:hypothetical protein